MPGWFPLTVECGMNLRMLRRFAHPLLQHGRKVMPRERGGDGSVAERYGSRAENADGARC